MTLRTLGLAALAMFGASTAVFALALCRAAARGDQPIEDNTGYPGLPDQASRRAHPARGGRQ